MLCQQHSLSHRQEAQGSAEARPAHAIAGPLSFNKGKFVEDPECPGAAQVRLDKLTFKTLVKSLGADIAHTVPDYSADLRGLKNCWLVLVLGCSFFFHPSKTNSHCTK